MHLLPSPREKKNEEKVNPPRAKNVRRRHINSTADVNTWRRRRRWTERITAAMNKRGYFFHIIFIPSFTTATTTTFCLGLASPLVLGLEKAKFKAFLSLGEDRGKW